MSSLLNTILEAVIAVGFGVMVFGFVMMCFWPKETS